MSMMPDSAGDDALRTADARARPAVGQPASPLALPLGIAGALALGVMTFSGLRSQTTDGALPPARSVPTANGLDQVPSLPAAPRPVAPAPPPMVLPPPPAPVAVPAAAPRKSPTTPALVVDLSTPPTAATAAAAEPPAAGGAATPERLGADEAFANRVNRTTPDTAHASKLSSQDQVIPQGTVITGVLETAINSDLPGLVRAVVSRDVTGFDGSKVLIPRGSRLIGQYSNGVALGQSRAFVIWTRLLRADGVSIQLGSPTTDPLGTAGLGGKVNSHFLRRFGAATFLSVLNGAIDYASRGTSTQLYIGSSSSATQLAALALQKQIDIPPTIRIAQGTPVLVFVARDLDFTGTKP